MGVEIPKHVCPICHETLWAVEPLHPFALGMDSLTLNEALHNWMCVTIRKQADEILAKEKP